MASTQCRGREYASLSAACGPGQSTRNKENMVMGAARSNEQQAFFFVRFLTVLRVIFSPTCAPSFFSEVDGAKVLARKAAPLPLKRSPRSTRAQPLARLGVCKRGHLMRC